MRPSPSLAGASSFTVGSGEARPKRMWVMGMNGMPASRPVGLWPDRLHRCSTTSDNIFAAYVVGARTPTTSKLARTTPGQHPNPPGQHGNLQRQHSIRSAYGGTAGTPDDICRTDLKPKCRSLSRIAGPKLGLAVLQVPVTLATPRQAASA